MATKVLTDSEIAAAAKAAGFNGEEVVIATAIALAESSGNIYAHNQTGLDNSYGLMQINMRDEPVKRRKLFGITSNDQLYDPAVNMKAARILYTGRGNWHDWSVYLRGTYRLYLPRARKAAGSPASSIPDIGSGTATQVGFTSSAGEFVDFVTAGSTWKRVGFILAGAALILVSLSMISGAGGRAKMLADVATNVLPVGRAAKSVKGA